MGTINRSNGSEVKRNIKIVDVTGYTVSQLENAFNSNYGLKGWKFIQALVISNKTFMIFEKEI